MIVADSLVKSLVVGTPASLGTDHAYLQKYIRMLDPNILLGEGMTAIGEGISTAVDLFRREGDPETKNKVIFVLGLVCCLGSLRG